MRAPDRREQVTFPPTNVTLTLATDTASIVLSTTEVTLVRILAGSADIFIAAGTTPVNTVGMTILANHDQHFFIPINHKVTSFNGTAELSY
jgi:hypothetical protein